MKEQVVNVIIWTLVVICVSIAIYVLFIRGWLYGNESGWYSFLLWKKYYPVDKNTAVSFMKFKKDLEQLQQGQEEMKQALRTIWSILERKK